MSRTTKAGRANAAVADCYHAVHAAANHKPAKPRASVSAFVQELRAKALHKLLPNGVRL